MTPARSHLLAAFGEPIEAGEGNQITMPAVAP